MRNPRHLPVKSFTRDSSEKAMAGRPMRVTVGTVWSFHVGPPPPTPQRLSVGKTVMVTLFTLMRVSFGVVYFHECPQHPNIPNYLLGLAMMTLLMIPFVTFPCESFAPQEPPRGLKLCLLPLLGLFMLVWALAGAVFVFSAYQPNYDPTAADGLYCNKNLYTFSFWNAVLDMFSLGSILAKNCRSVLVSVSISPTAGPSNV
ncbi:zgc:103586 isoform X1 [Takifugu flavidus]|uniref:zgc:103586 isoform X1 n=1 Tax=Takifugu flavidus TaxID=433684 RepID=UPI0025440356|nr:zgc:103586 isoform X1 [Takifugu flavidus]XP_056882976.1 zgc:103586 isoform X1 [Takifugu flavidus]